MVMGWDDLLLAAVPGVISWAGQSSANSDNQYINQQNNAFNAAQAADNRNFQYMMSNTAFQRATKDMAAAGINPMVAFSQGGASTPSGSSASAANAQKMEDALGRGVSSAVDSLRLKNERQRMELEGARLKNETKGVEADARYKAAAAVTQSAVAMREQASAKSAQLETSLLERRMPALLRAAEIDRKKTDMDSKSVEYDWWFKKVQDAVGVGASAASAYRAARGYGFTGSQVEFTKQYEKMLRKSGAKGIEVPVDEFKHFKE